MTATRLFFGVRVCPDCDHGKDTTKLRMKFENVTKDRVSVCESVCLENCSVWFRFSIESHFCSDDHGKLAVLW